MVEFLQGWTLAAAAITGTGAAAAVIWKLFKGTERVATAARKGVTDALAEALEPKITEVVDDRIGRALEPVQIQITKIAAAMAVMADLMPALAELLPNGGSSIKDQMQRVYDAMTRETDPPKEHNT